MSAVDKYEVVIGLEIHAQLKTNTKLFCSCSTKFGEQPNSNVCPICMGYPGVLPVLNETALDYAIKAGLALNCRINHKSKFDRKQYFYPDLPKGYQISQYDQPLVQDGYLEMPDHGKVRINRIHMEEDAGKLVHAGAERLHGSVYSLVDLNRAGTPLIEIVSEPDIRSPEQAKAYVQELRLILVCCDICDGNLEEGSLRCDVNISLRPKGTEKFGTRAEIKNVNSFRSIQRAIEYEIERQAEILESGGKVVQETRLWEEAGEQTVSMRSKEEANDYRYFPEPDLRPITLTIEKIEAIKKMLPVLPEQKRKIYEEQYNLNSEEVYILVEDLERGDFFDKVMKLHDANPKKVASLLNVVVAGYLKEKHLALHDTKLTPERMVELVGLLESGIIGENVVKTDLLEDLFTSSESLKDICKNKGLEQTSDEDEIKKIIENVLSENQDKLAEYKLGKVKLRGFFVGQIMKKFEGKASAQVVNKVLDELLA